MEVKYCKKCELYKNIDCFSKKSKTKSGIQTYQPKCKECSNIEQVVYRNKEGHKEKTKSYDKEYYLKHKGSILENKKNYYILNSESILEKKKHYRNILENRNNNILYQKNYRITSKEKIKIYRKKFSHVGMETYAVSNIIEHKNIKK